MIIDFDIIKNRQNLGKLLTRRVSVQHPLNAIPGPAKRHGALQHLASRNA